MDPIYANAFLNTEELVTFQTILTRLEGDFEFNRSSDRMQLELLAAYFVKLTPVFTSGDWETAEKIDRLIRAHLKDLKTTKITREGDAPNQNPAFSQDAFVRLILAKDSEASTEGDV